MSQSETLWTQLELFEAESRMVDGILSQEHGDAEPSKPFRRPQRLRHKHWPPGAELNTELSSCQNDVLEKEANAQSFSTADTPYDKKISINGPDSVSVTGSETSQKEKLKFYLCGKAFSTQDPVSVCIDTCCSDAVNCTAKLRMKKPERLKEKYISKSSCSLSSAADLFSALGGDFLVTGIDGTSGSSSSEVVKNLTNNRKKLATAAGQSKKHCYALRSHRMEDSRSETEPVSSRETSRTRSEMVTGVSFCASDSSALEESVPSTKEAQRTKGTKKRQRSNCSQTSGDASENVKDGDTGLGGREKSGRKRRGGAKNESAVAEDHGDDSRQGNDTDTMRQRNKRRKTAGCVRRQRLEHQEGRQVFRQRLRHEKRHVVSRGSTLLCSSCKHGLMRSECLLCVAVDTATHRIVQKAKQPRCSTNVGQCGGVKGRSLNGRMPCTKQVAVSIVPPQHRAFSSAKRAGCGEKTSQSESSGLHPPRPLRKAALTVNSTNLGKKNDGKVFKRKSSVENIPAKDGSLTTKKRKQQCSSPQQHQHRKTKEQIPSAAKRQKLCRDASVGGKQRPDRTADSSVLVDSIIDFHKRASVAGSENGGSFSSAKDVFSQLCQLEERSKDYDISTLQSVMPIQEQVEEHRAAPSAVSVYSRKSHVGGVWKSIFS
ncbi:uncharacterized protein LOC143288998 isoform X2 [Babylonia areolata]